MAKGKLIFYSSLLVLIGIIFVYRAPLFNYFAPRFLKLETTAIQTAANEINKQISVPPPLRAPAKKPSTSTTTAPAAALTRSGIITYTNRERKNNGGLAALTENSKLDEIARLRMEDMFAKQYFAHVSPASSSAITVSAVVGYDYLALGENLALGDFTDSNDIVQAWMNSPGHRANILNTQYQEIGVAVRQGIFEGNKAWLGVQIFGKPASACPQPDASLKASIESSQAQLGELQQSLVALKADIDNTPQRSPQYNQKVDQYNAMVSQYNTLLAQVKGEINQYNIEVTELNQCIAS